MAVSEESVRLTEDVSGPAGQAFDAVVSLGRGFADLAKSIASEDWESVGKILAEGAQAVAVAAVELVEKGADYAIAMTTAKEEAVDALTAITGSAAAGEQAFDKALELAETLNITKDKAITEYKKLAGDGFGEKQIAQVVEAVADLDKARSGQGDKLLKIVETIQTKGKIDNGAITQLAKMGISTEEIYAKLAATTGKSLADVKAGVKAGTIDAQSAVDAVLESVEDKFGGIAKKSAQSIPGLLNTLKLEFEKLFTFDDATIKPVKDALAALVDGIKGPEGQALGAALKDFFGSLFEAIFGPLGSGQGPATVKDVLASITAGIKSMTGFLKEHKQEIHDAITGALVLVGALAKLGAAFASQKETTVGGVGIGPIKDALLLLIPVIGPVVFGLKEMSSMWKLLSGDFSSIDPNGMLSSFKGLGTGIIDSIVLELSNAPAALESALASAFGIDTAMSSSTGNKMGADLISGIVQGITSGVSAVVSAITSMASAAISAANAAFGRHSPSREFADIGVDLPGGLGVGVSKGTGQAVSATKRMADAVIQAGKLANDNGVVSPALASSLPRGPVANDTSARGAPPAAAPLPVLKATGTSGGPPSVGEVHVHLAQSTAVHAKDEAEATKHGEAHGKAHAETVTKEIRAFFRRMKEER